MGQTTHDDALRLIQFVAIYGTLLSKFYEVQSVSLVAVSRAGLESASADCSAQVKLDMASDTATVSNHLRKIF